MSERLGTQAALPLLLAFVAALGLVVRGQEPAPRKQPGAEARRASQVARAVARARTSVVRVEVVSGNRRGDLPRWRFHRKVAHRVRASGVVVGKDLLLTHGVLALYHQPTYVVTTPRGTRFQARLLHLDGARELAVLKTKRALDAPPAGTARSARLRVGNLVIAVADPFGMAKDGLATATLGILEGRTRLRAPETAYPGQVLLTDASINPGSEGGALVDLDGALVGILAPLVQDQRLARPAFALAPGGLSGYAIPVEAALGVLRDATAPRVSLGFTGRAGARGLEVVRVRQGGRAAKAGLRPGDVIRSAGGKQVRTGADLKRAVARSGRKPLSLRVERSGRTRAVELDLGKGGGE